MLRACAAVSRAGSCSRCLVRRADDPSGSAVRRSPVWRVPLLSGGKGMHSADLLRSSAKWPLHDASPAMLWWRGALVWAWCDGRRRAQAVFAGDGVGGRCRFLFVAGRRAMHRLIALLSFCWLSVSCGKAKACTGPECADGGICIIRVDAGCRWREPNCCGPSAMPLCGATNFPGNEAYLLKLEHSDAGGCDYAGGIGGG